MVTNESTVVKHGDGFHKSSSRSDSRCRALFSALRSIGLSIMIGNASVDARKWNEGSITERHSGCFYMPLSLLFSVRTGLSNFLKRGKTGNFLAKKGPLRIACEDG